MKSYSRYNEYVHVGPLSSIFFPMATLNFVTRLLVIVGGLNW